jgi:hypothetical protein
MAAGRVIDFTFACLSHAPMLPPLAPVQLAIVAALGEDEPGRRSAGKLLSKDEANFYSSEMRRSPACIL